MLYTLLEAAAFLHLDVPFLRRLLKATGASRTFDSRQLIGERTLRMLYRKLHSPQESTPGSKIEAA